MNDEKKTEEFVVTGENIVQKVKQLIEEGNVTRVIVRGKDDQTIVEFPVTIGLVGVVLAPVLAAVGAVVALASDCKVVVVKK